MGAPIDWQCCLMNNPAKDVEFGSRAHWTRGHLTSWTLITSCGCPSQLQMTPYISLPIFLMVNILHTPICYLPTFVHQNCCTSNSGRWPPFFFLYDFRATFLDHLRSTVIVRQSYVVSLRVCSNHIAILQHFTYYHQCLLLTGVETHCVLRQFCISYVMCIFLHFNTFVLFCVILCASWIIPLPNCVERVQLYTRNCLLQKYILSYFNERNINCYYVLECSANWLNMFSFNCHLGGFPITNPSNYNPNHLAIDIGHCNTTIRVCEECI